MTTAASPPIDTFQDILNTLDQQPQLLQAMRGYILDREIRDIPNTVAQLVTTVAQLAEVTRSNTERIDRLEAAVARLEATVAQLAADQAELKATVAQLVEVTRSNTERIDRLEAAVAQLAADQAELKATVAQLVEVARSNTVRLDLLVERSIANAQQMNRVSGLVGQLAGTQYQRFVERIADRSLRRLLPISDVAVIHTDWNPGAVIREVTGSDNLSDVEARDVSVIDIIAAGQDAAGNTAYAAGEISITVQPQDVIKSAQRAAAVARALDATVHAVAIGQVIPDDTSATALEQGVTVIAIVPPD